MLIFLDSNIFGSDFHLISTNFELLKSYMAKVEIGFAYQKL